MIKVERPPMMAKTTTKKVMFYIFNFIKSAFFACVIAFFVALVVGFKPVLVVGYSMEPAIHYHDIILIRQVPKEEIQIGDVITFTLQEGGTACTHRVVGFKNDGFLTKGENPNASIDNQEVPLKYNQIDGKVFMTFPYLGNILLFIARPLNMIIILVSALLIMVLCSIFSKKTQMDYLHK